MMTPTMSGPRFGGALVVFVVLAVFANSACDAGDFQGAGDGELIAVVAAFRHGERTITHSYPTDPYQNISFWPGGFGQLVNKGKQQAYSLGLWLRKRYDGFLPAEYSSQDIRVQSTDMDRTLMTAAACLAALYPPTPDQDWNPSLKWQPIPIHTMPQTEDAVIRMRKPCAKFDKLHKQLLKSPYFIQLDKELEDLYEYITEHSKSKVNKLSRVKKMYGVLSIEDAFNYTLPDWTRRVYPEPLRNLSAIMFSTYAYTSEMARLRTGPFFNELVEYFQSITTHRQRSISEASYYFEVLNVDEEEAGESIFPKMRLYSTHDSTLASLLTALKLYDSIVDFTATLIFELRLNDSQYYVNIFYKNNTDTAVPHELVLPGCSFNCEFSKFVQLLAPITVSPEEWQEECEEEDDLEDGQIPMIYNV